MSKSAQQGLALFKSISPVNLADYKVSAQLQLSFHKLAEVTGPSGT